MDALLPGFPVHLFEEYLGFRVPAPPEVVCEVNKSGDSLRNVGKLVVYEVLHEILSPFLVVYSPCLLLYMPTYFPYNAR